MNLIIHQCKMGKILIILSFIPKIKRFWRYVWTRDKAENQYWMQVIFGSSDITALKTPFCHGNHCMSSGTRLEVIFHEHSSLCHPQMQVKALSSKEEEALSEHDPETPPSSLGQLKWGWKWLRFRWIQILKFCFKSLIVHILWTKERRDHAACYQSSVQNPASLMLLWCISDCGTSGLNIWKGTTNVERYIQQCVLPFRLSQESIALQ